MPVIRDSEGIVLASDNCSLWISSISGIEEDLGATEDVFADAQP